MHWDQCLHEHSENICHELHLIDIFCTLDVIKYSNKILNLFYIEFKTFLPILFYNIIIITCNHHQLFWLSLFYNTCERMYLITTSTVKPEISLWTSPVSNTTLYAAILCAIFYKTLFLLLFVAWIFHFQLPDPTTTSLPTEHCHKITGLVLWEAIWEVLEVITILVLIIYHEKFYSGIPRQNSGRDKSTPRLKFIHINFELYYKEWQDI